MKRHHIAAYRINWNDKVNNIVSLAEELNLGLDSFVMLDDSPTECGLVKSLLPEVTVIQVPESLSKCPSMITRSGLFDTLQIGKEDRNRTELYQAEAERKIAKKEFGSVEEYLASLELAVLIHPMEKHEIPRVAQLTQKTNQFNLTTRRYSEAQLQAFSESVNSEVFTLDVRDKFGDMGLTGVMILLGCGDKGIVDTLLLSCRILGRQIEYVFTEFCLSSFEATREIRLWEAEYLATRKNQQVARFWDDLRFRRCSESENEVHYSCPSAERVQSHVSFIRIMES